MPAGSYFAPTPEAVSAFVNRYLRFNFAAALVDAIGWPLGMSIISSATILPLFVSKLGGSNVLVGLIPALFSLGYLLPQLFVAHWVEGMTTHRRYVMALAMVERAFIAAMVPLTLLWYETRPTWLLCAFFLCFGAHSLSMGCNNPAYTALISKVIPAERRGRLYGIGGAVGGLLGLGGALLARHLLATCGLRVGFALCFMLATLILVMSVIPLGLIREYHSRRSTAYDSWLTYAGCALSVLRMDKQFSRFLVSQILQSFSGMAGAFYTVYAIRRFGAGPSEVGTYTAVLQATFIVAGPLCGLAGDHLGNRWLLVMGSILTVAAPLAAVAIPNSTLYLLVFVLSAVAGNAYELAVFNIVMEFCPPEQVPTYAALRATAIAPFRTIAPMVGGLLADIVGYPTVFVASAAAALAGIPVLLSIREPRYERQTLRLDGGSDMPKEGAVTR
ncbi:MAG: MFS transporter [Armatimonadota bacterium]